MLMVCIAPTPSLRCMISVFNPYRGMNTDNNTIATITKPTFIASLAILIRFHFPRILLELLLPLIPNPLNRSSSHRLKFPHIYTISIVYSVD
jgi:hypothetical protein